MLALSRRDFCAKRIFSKNVSETIDAGAPLTCRDQDLPPCYHQKLAKFWKCLFISDTIDADAPLRCCGQDLSPCKLTRFSKYFFVSEAIDADAPLRCCGQGLPPCYRQKLTKFSKWSFCFWKYWCTWTWVDDKLSYYHFPSRSETKRERHQSLYSLSFREWQFVLFDVY